MLHVWHKMAYIGWRRVCLALTAMHLERWLRGGRVVKEFNKRGMSRDCKGVPARHLYLHPVHLNCDVLALAARCNYLQKGVHQIV